LICSVVAPEPKPRVPGPFCGSIRAFHSVDLCDGRDGRSFLRDGDDTLGPMAPAMPDLLYYAFTDFAPDLTWTGDLRTLSFRPSSFCLEIMIIENGLP
jgi:hypothetical protein